MTLCQPVGQQPHPPSNLNAMDSTLDEITSQLEQSILDGDLLPNPKLATMELTDTPAPQDPASSPENISLAEPLQVADYSVYGEQVNC